MLTHLLCAVCACVFMFAFVCVSVRACVFVSGCVCIHV